MNDKKLGRPPLPDEERRDRCFTIRVNESERERLLGADAQPYRWAREVLLRAAAKRK